MIIVNAHNTVVPLFPLETVLFPHIAIPLHVFEPRYRELVLYCLEHDSPFGVVLIREGREVGDPEPQLYEVGTLARIGRLRRLEDGRFQLLAMGEERFRIQHLIRGEIPYLQAEIIAWHDHPTNWDDLSAITASLHAQFLEFLRAVLEPMGVQVNEFRLPEDPVALSFVLAGTLQGSPQFRQYLLEIQDTAERLRLISELLHSVSLASEVRPFDPNYWQEYVQRN